MGIGGTDGSVDRAVSLAPPQRLSHYARTSIAQFPFAPPAHIPFRSPLLNPMPIDPSRWTLLACSALLALGTGCSSDDDEGPRPFVITTLTPAVIGSTPVVVSGQQMAFLASESETGASGTNYNAANGDSDTGDDIAFLVGMDTDVVTGLAVAADPTLAAERTLAFVNGTLFIVVSEAADTRDWNGDTDTDDRVLVYAQPGATGATYLADLDGAAIQPLVTSSAHLVYQTAEVTPGSGLTNLYRVAVASFGTAPATPVQVSTALVDSGDDGVFANLVASENGVVSALLDEGLEGELNGDGSADDDYTLALLDGAIADGLLVSTGMTVSGPSPSVRALQTSDGVWAAFLVDEASMEENFNTPAVLGSAWQPPQCSSQDDGDQLDEVLHWLYLDDFVADPIGSAPENTGLVGTGQVYSLNDDFVGTVSFEVDEGSGGGCDLNGDGDSDDRIFRWVEVQSGATPPGTASRLHAVDAGMPGGSGGVIELNGGLWVIAADEGEDGRDLNGDSAEDRTLVGVLDPLLTGTDFNFDQGNSVFAEPTWMAADQRTPSRFTMALTERSVGADNNGDGTQNDSVPTFPFEAAPRELNFPGANVAVSETNAGILTADGFGFYRAREASQGTDYNNDGDLGDFALLRISLSGSEPTTYMGLLQNLVRPAVEPGPSSTAFGIGWVVQEGQQGTTGADLNGDGDTDDFVVRYTRLP